MKRIYETIKEDVGLVPQSIVSANKVGEYFSMKNYRQVLAHLIAGPVVTSGSITVALLQATDALGSNSKPIAGATATLTAETKCNALEVFLAAVGAGDLLVINGLTFTKGATVVATRTFNDAAGLILCVNDATYGVPGVKATVDPSLATGVILTSAEPGEVYITATETNVGGAITFSTLEAEAFVEVEVSQLDISNAIVGQFTHVAVSVTTVLDTSTCAVSLQRGLERYLADQIVGASAVV